MNAAGIFIVIGLAGIVVSCASGCGDAGTIPANVAPPVAVQRPPL